MFTHGDMARVKDTNDIVEIMSHGPRYRRFERSYIDRANNTSPEYLVRWPDGRETYVWIRLLERVSPLEALAEQAE